MKEAMSSLDKNISTGFLLKFALPTIIANVAMGVFGVVDGVFASRLIDPYALSAVKLIMPFMMFVLAVGLMFGIGGSVLIAKEIGQGFTEQARKNFSFVSFVGILSAIILAVLAGLFPNVLFNILGVDAYMHELTWEYAGVALPFVPVITAGMIFQQFFITEGKAHYGMIAIGIGGAVSFVLNVILIPTMGLQGAALATVIGYSIPAIFGFLFFSFNRKGLLYFVMPDFKLSILLRVMSNGVPELIASMAIAISSIVMNNIVMDLDGPMAVAAAGIQMAAMNIMSGVFIGYSTGISPLISYNYGKNEHGRLKQIFRSSLWITIGLAIITVVLTLLFTDQFIRIYDLHPLVYIGGFIITLPIYEMSYNSVRMLAFAYLFMGVNIFASVFFTSFNDGKTSGVISFLRGIFFIIISLHVMANIWGIDGVWMATSVAEILTLFVSVYFLVKLRKVYHYA